MEPVWLPAMAHVDLSTMPVFDRAGNETFPFQGCVFVTTQPIISGRRYPRPLPTPFRGIASPRGKSAIWCDGGWMELKLYKEGDKYYNFVVHKRRKTKSADTSR